MADLVLATERLELRMIDPGDLEAHMQHLNSPAVMARLGGPRTREQLVEKHEKSRAGFAKDGFGFMFAYERSTGELVAHCGMKRVDNSHAPNVGDHEIGWLVREDRWRMGYAEEAVGAIIDWAFAAHSAPHLVALTSEANIGSWKLMEKLGMVRRPDLEFADPSFPAEDSPTIQYSLTKEQWETI
ncbi:MAG: GNAT family N-acetyltransferase [Pseudomonadota bacterium]